MQAPAVMPVTVLLLTEQTLGVMLLKLTVRPEVAVAEVVPVLPTTTIGAVPKLTVWLVLLTLEVAALLPLQVPPSPEPLSVHVPEIAPVTESIAPLKVAPVDTEPAVIDNEPVDDAWPLAVNAPDVLELPVAVMLPIDEIVVVHVPLSAPEKVPE